MSYLCFSTIFSPPSPVSGNACPCSGTKLTTNVAAESLYTAQAQLRVDKGHTHWPHTSHSCDGCEETLGIIALM